MTLAEIDKRIPQYRNKGLLVDTNLLLLYLIGELDPELIPRFKRTQGYKISDFQHVKTFIDFFPTVVTLPNILTEVSNLAGQLREDLRFLFFARFAGAIQKMREEFVFANDAASHASFQSLGLTDSAIILACKGKYLALTADLLLARFMENNRLDVINFNHIREMDWD